MKQEEKKNNRTAVIATVLFHIGILLFMLLASLKYMDPPPQVGVEVNLGFVDEGSNNQITDENTQASQTSSSEAVESSTDLTQDVEEAPVIDKKNNEKPTKDKEPKKNTEPKPNDDLSNAMNNSFKGDDKSTSSDGNSDKTGNQGNPNGNNNSNNYTGGGGGNGVDFSLSGRSMTRKPTINDNSQEEGKVVVDILVNSAGNVYEAKPGARGTTTTSKVLWEKAKQAALTTKFNTSEQEIQKGTITFVFKLK